MIVLTYVDDCILISKETSVIDEFIQSLQNGPENFDFTDEGTMSSYLGVDVSRLPDGNGFTLSQPYLIQRIIEASILILQPQKVLVVILQLHTHCSTKTLMDSQGKLCGSTDQ